MCIRDRGTGDILLNGESTRKKKTEQLSRSISLVYQNPEEMFIKDSIRADISYAMQVRDVENWQARTDELLARFRLTELQDQDGRLLSGGQMRRASLAIGVALNPGILLLDEMCIRDRIYGMTARNCSFPIVIPPGFLWTQ